MYVAGPPRNDPSGMRRLNACASVHSIRLVAMPTRAIIHIQKTAPGPPSVIATATPAMFPPPTRPPIETTSAWRALIWSGSATLSPPPRTRHMRPKYFSWMNLVEIVKTMPKMTSIGISDHPQVKKSI